MWGAEGQILAGIWAVLCPELLLWYISVLQRLKSAVLGYAPADVAPEFPSSSRRRYSCYLRLLLCAGALQTWQLPEPLPNYMVCMLYVPCDHQDKKRVNNSKLRATEHKNPQTKSKNPPPPKKWEVRKKNKDFLFLFFFAQKGFVAAQPDTLRLRIARSPDLSFVYCSSSVTLRKCCYDLTKTCKIETFAGEIFSLFHLLFLKGQKLGGKMTHSVGLLILKCLELLWVRPGCGTPGDSQGFITPFHVILQFSNPWKKYSSRMGEGNPLLFDLQVFLLQYLHFNPQT